MTNPPPDFALCTPYFPWAVLKLVWHFSNSFLESFKSLFIWSYNLTVRYDKIYSSDDADFNSLDAQVKTSILYPTGYNGKRFMLTTTKPSKNGRYLKVDFSTKIPSTGSYVKPNEPIVTKY